MPADQHNLMGTRTQESSDEKTEKTNAVYQVESVYQVELKSLVSSCTRLSPSFVMVSRKSTLLWSLGDLGNHQPLGCRTAGVINRRTSSVSATSGSDKELHVSDEILQNFGMKTSFSKDGPKLPNN